MNVKEDAAKKDIAYTGSNVSEANSISVSVCLLLMHRKFKVFEFIKQQEFTCGYFVSKCITNE